MVKYQGFGFLTGRKSRERVVFMDTKRGGGGPDPCSFRVCALFCMLDKLPKKKTSSYTACNTVILVDWFLYDNGPHHERVNFLIICVIMKELTS